MTITEHITKLLQAPIETLGFQLWGIEWISSRNTTLRIYIDSPQGITIEDCALVSRHVSSILDVEDPITQEYNLEVSSPGMDRPIFTLEQYQSYTGEFVALQLRLAQQDARRFMGKIISCSADTITLSLEPFPKKNQKQNVVSNQEYPTIEIAFNNILRGNLKPQV